MNVCGLFQSHRLALEATKNLEQAGFDGDRISVVSPHSGADIHGLPENRKDKERKSQAIKLGATVGTATGAAAVAIVSGPLLALLGAAAGGAVVGSLTGALAGQGVTVQRAEEYEEEIWKGKTLVVFHADNEAEAKQVRQLMVNNGAGETFLAEQVGATKTEPSGGGR